MLRYVYLILAGLTACMPNQATDEAWTMHVVDNTSSGADGTKLADVNGDLLPDIASGWEQGNIARLYIQPYPLKENWEYIEVPAPNVEDALPVDLDADGFYDMVTCSEGEHKRISFHWAPANKKAYLGSDNWQSVDVPVSIGKTRWMFAEPMQVDGKFGVDLVVGSKDPNATLGWLEAPENPREVAEWKYHEITPANWIMSIEIIDINQDGKMDILASDRNGPHRGIWWFDNPGTNQPALYDHWPRNAIGMTDADPLFLDVADTDEDGLWEIWAPNLDTYFMYFEQKDPSGKYWQAEKWEIPTIAGKIGKSAALGDINLDGIIDLVTTYDGAREKSGVLWSEQNRKGQWLHHDISGLSGIKYDFATLTDMDGDGDLDVLTCEEANNSKYGPGLGVIWYENPLLTAPPDHWFEIQTLGESFDEPQEMEVLPNGNVLFIERGGCVQYYEATSRDISRIAQIPVISSQSNGLTGMALDPNFAETGWVYMMYPRQGDTTQLLITRFVFDDGQINLASEEIIFRIPFELRNGWHGPGSLSFDTNGNLYISIGDFTLQSQDIAGYAQIDERPDQVARDAQRTSANSQSYMGKILRIHPEQEGGYTIPEGNLFPADGSVGKPEIYVMGCRNPYRFSLDPITGFLYFGDVGPDAWGDSPQKGPRGYDEINIVQEAGFYGWPYFVADNKAYRDYHYATQQGGAFFDPTQPINDSPNNNGIRELPPAQPAVCWYPKAPSTTFPHLGQGGINIMAGPIYYPDRYPPSPQKLPAYYEGKLFIYDWVRRWIRTLTIDENQKTVAIKPFLDSYSFNKIIDMEFGPDGTLYLLEYGDQGYRANENAALKRIIYTEGCDRPQSVKAPKEDSSLYLPEVPGYERGKELILSHNCLSCHRGEGKLVGPGFQEIALRYANDPQAPSRLAQTIIQGGSGKWDGNIIMPSHTHISTKESNRIVSYIMTLRFLPN